MVESENVPGAGPVPSPDGPFDFSRGYSPLPGASDEMIEPGGALRPHWREFVRLLDELGPRERARRWAQARSLIHDNGVTHNIYGDPDGLDRPWRLDFLPVLIPAGEWDRLSLGLEQRARLLDRLLADLYGPGQTLAEGLLPEELVYGNGGFWRSCHGMTPPLGRWLHLYAADVVRTAEGGFEVLSDRTQAPSGAGYSLENRIVLSRVLPSAFRECHVRRLAPFFSSLRTSLAELGPANRESPRVVLLTPGPYNETYFEHVYLARYLGYTLVQGNDLTVRDARVYVKTLGGLQPVDVVLRRVDDDYCDPLELYPDSFLGVPGLLMAAREGNVAIANALGSGVLQAPGFLPFLPALSRRLLGEELRLPSVRTWWCGDEASRAYVLEHLGALVLKPAMPTTGTDPVFGSDLGPEELSELAARIRSSPAEFVAQEPSMVRTTPALDDEGVCPRRFGIRAYLAAGRGGYSVMAGGLARIPWSADSFMVSMQKGGGSKDVWILTDGPVEETTLLAPGSQPVALSRGGGDLPSRIADDLFWLGRYTQRAEATVRVARSAVSRRIDAGGEESRSAVRALGRALHAPQGPASPDVELLTAVFGTPGGGGLRSTAGSILRLARVQRDRISVDSWRILQGIEREVSRFKVAPEDPFSGVMDLLDGLVASFAAFDGLSVDSMMRDQAWRFLDLGRRLERALAVSRLLRNTLVEALEDEGSVLEAILEVTDSSLTYRLRYMTRLETPALVDLLLADETHPRAVAYQAAEMGRLLDSLPHEWTHPREGEDRRRSLQLLTLLKLADVGEACRVVDGRREGLDTLLGSTLGELGLLSESIGRIYFAHAAVPRGLRAPAGEETST